jgi:hemerythrin superfamily protein
MRRSAARGESSGSLDFGLVSAALVAQDVQPASAQSTDRRGNTMAKARSAKRGRRSKTTQSRRSQRSGGDDAVGLLKADHREVERLFASFESARSQERKQEIATQICEALKTHTTIEEEIFYPAFLEATDETDIHHEAEVEHEGAKYLIQEIESAGADDDHFEARVTVLQEMIRHHVKEEEQRGGMFSKAQSSDMDLAELGLQMRDRKLELMGETSDDMTARRRPPEGRARRTSRELRER